jgi:protein-S-isoprenylcysteine O-methyltransferase Ste14
MNIFKNWQDQESSVGRHLLFLVLGALIFPISIPALLVILLPQVDKKIGMGSFFIGKGNIIIGILFIFLGGVLAFWTIFPQIKLASGTPFPMLPTKRLLIVGPFKYCRNPMTLGTLMAYAGIAVIVGSVASLLFVVLFAMVLTAYIKLVEEKELELRFGTEYVDYKKVTPFIIHVRFASVKKK